MIPLCLTKVPPGLDIIKLEFILKFFNLQARAKNSSEPCRGSMPPLSCIFVLNLFFHFQGAIIIHEVYEDGAAFRDRRLMAGDQVLEVNIILANFGHFHIIPFLKLSLITCSTYNTVHFYGPKT